MKRKIVQRSRSTPLPVIYEDGNAASISSDPEHDASRSSSSSSSSVDTWFEFNNMVSLVDWPPRGELSWPPHNSDDYRPYSYLDPQQRHHDEDDVTKQGLPCDIFSGRNIQAQDAAGAVNETQINSFYDNSSNSSSESSTDIANWYSSNDMHISNDENCNNSTLNGASLFHSGVISSLASPHQQKQESREHTHYCFGLTETTPIRTLSHAYYSTDDHAIGSLNRHGADNTVRHTRMLRIWQFLSIFGMLTFCWSLVVLPTTMPSQDTRQQGHFTSSVPVFEERDSDSTSFRTKKSKNEYESSRTHGNSALWNTQSTQMRGRNEKWEEDEQRRVHHHDGTAGGGGGGHWKYPKPWTYLFGSGNNIDNATDTDEDIENYDGEMVDDDNYDSNYDDDVTVDDNAVENRNNTIINSTDGINIIQNSTITTTTLPNSTVSIDQVENSSSAHQDSDNDDDFSMIANTITFADLAAVMLPPYFQTTIELCKSTIVPDHPKNKVKHNKNTGLDLSAHSTSVKPDQVFLLRKTLLKTRDMLDVFAPVYPRNLYHLGDLSFETRDSVLWAKERGDFKIELTLESGERKLHYENRHHGRHRDDHDENRYRGHTLQKMQSNYQREERPTKMIASSSHHDKGGTKPKIKDFWTTLRNYFDEGYTVIGEFQDLDHAKINYTLKQLAQYQLIVWKWHVAFISFVEENYLDIMGYLSHPCPIENLSSRGHSKRGKYRSKSSNIKAEYNPVTSCRYTHSKSSHLFWGGTSKKDLPEGNLVTATDALGQIGREQLVRAKMYLNMLWSKEHVIPKASVDAPIEKDRVAKVSPIDTSSGSMNSSLLDYDTPADEKDDDFDVHEVYHNLRKEIRSFLDEVDLFGPLLLPDSLVHPQMIVVGLENESLEEMQSIEAAEQSAVATVSPSVNTTEPIEIVSDSEAIEPKISPPIMSNESVVIGAEDVKGIEPYIAPLVNSSETVDINEGEDFKPEVNFSQSVSMDASDGVGIGPLIVPPVDFNQSVDTGVRGGDVIEPQILPQANSSQSTDTVLTNTNEKENDIIKNQIPMNFSEAVDMDVQSEEVVKPETTLPTSSNEAVEMDEGGNEITGQQTATSPEDLSRLTNDALAVLTLTRKLLGDLNDDYTAYTKYIEWNSNLGEQVRLLETIEEEWSYFKSWASEIDLNGKMDFLISRMTLPSVPPQRESILGEDIVKRDKITDGFYTLDLFLTKRKLKATNHIMIGNEAGDADTIISAISLAYIESMYSKYGDSVQATPIVPIPKESFLNERPDVNLLLNLADLQDVSDKLLFIEDLMHMLLDHERLDVTLVDQNTLNLPLIQYKENLNVVEIIDHHFDEEEYHETCSGVNRTIAFDQGKALVASTCTLVAEKLKSLAAHELYPESIGTLLLGVILMDSVNLDENFGKVTQRDRDAVRDLVACTDWRSSASKNFIVEDENGHVTIDTNAMFDRLQRAKYEPSFWNSIGVERALPYDYKDFYSHRSKLQDTVGHKFGIASILMSGYDFAKKDGFVLEVLKFLSLNQISFLSIMFAFYGTESEEVFRRQIAFCADPTIDLDNFVNQLLNSEEYENVDLNLTEATEDLSFLHKEDLQFYLFNQNNVRPSRKQIGPMLEAAYGKFII